MSRSLPSRRPEAGEPLSVLAAQIEAVLFLASSPVSEAELRGVFEVSGTELARAIKERAPKMGVYLAGEPAPEFKDAYVEAGVEGFISVRSNCLETLSGFQKMKGML